MTAPTRRKAIAGEDLPFEGLVILAQGRAWNATYGTATHHTGKRSPWDDEMIQAGTWITVLPLADWEVLDLQALANGRLMDPNKINLPAGRLSTAQYEQRLADDFRRAGISREERP